MELLFVVDALSTLSSAGALDLLKKGKLEKAVEIVEHLANAICLVK